MKDDAVAEVIGVILIVAITVIVAAIVAAFAYNMVSIKQPYQVYFKLDKPAPLDNVIITNAGGTTDLTMLKTIEISYTNAAGIQTSFDTPENIIAASSGHASGDLSNQITSSLLLDHTMVKPNGQCHVVVRGTFVDDTQQVLMQGDI